MMNDLIELPPSATGFVAKQAADRREAVCAAVVSAGLVAHPVTSLGLVSNQHKATHPACLVADIPTVETENPDLISALIKSDVETPVELEEKGADTHTLVISTSLLEDVYRALEAGGVAFLRRPYTRGQLLDAIDRAIARDQAYQQRLTVRREVEQRSGHLSPREREVMRMIYDGLPNKVIAKRLDVSIRTVESIRSKILVTMGADTAVDLARLLAEADYYDEPAE